MSDVFISYSREEKPRAEQLARALELSGFSVYWDKQIKAGMSWAAEIEEALNDAKCIVVLWSANSTQSEWVREEAAYGRELNKLLPVMVEDVRLPLQFRTLKSAVLTDWNGERNHPGFLELMEAIQLKVQG